MKKILIVLLLAAIAPFSFGQKVDVYQRPVQAERSREYNALHYQVSLDVDMAAKSLTGRNRITLVPLNNGLKTCTLDAEYLVVSRVSTPKGKALTFKQNDKQVVVDLGGSFGHADTIRLDVEYSLTKQNLGLRFFDQTATNPRMASSDCFPNKAHYWIPCYDHPNDKVTMEMKVTVDESDKVLSNGRLVSVTSSAPGKKTWHWSQEQPHSTYLISLSIGNFAVIRDSLGSLPVNYWVYDYHVKDAILSFRKTPQMIRFYSDLYGFEYPWAKYDQVISPYMGGGAEATSATLLGEGAVTDEKAIQDFSYERVIAHEIAHHWWGDLITLRSWEHTWMNESFGTYSDYLYTRNEYGEDVGAWDLQGKKNQYLNEARNRYIRPIVFNRWDDPGDNFDSHTYPKGATVLHLLRYILGDDAFFRTLSAFLHEHAFQPVDTHDFMKTIKEVTGKNMDWFFEQYVFRPGHAVFEVTKSWDKSRKVLKVNILQKQDSLRDVPIYTVPVNIGFHFPASHVTREVWLSKKSETFEFAFESEPLLVRFDEGNYLLKECTFKKPMPELIYQATHDDVIGRYSAVEELNAFAASPEAIQTWTQRAADPFWSVRQAALNALARHARDGNMSLFIQAATNDPNSKVRQTAVRILGETGDPKQVKLLKQIFEKENSYVVQAESLTAIGKCGGKKQVSFLKKAAEVKSYRNIVQKSANEALTRLQ